MAYKPQGSEDGGCLSKQAIRENFGDLHEPFSLQQAIEEANRCLYCYEAPCTIACPTSIDIPKFIHQIRTENVQGSAKTILDSNIMGGTCARVCPTEVLCEEACVMDVAVDTPVAIGHLQRFAVDSFLADDPEHPFQRQADTGYKVAIVGAGPAGLACAHKLATQGHEVMIFEAKEKASGLNEYGLAAYKMVDDFAQKEVDFITQIGGIKIQYGQKLGGQFNLPQLTSEFDAVFLGVGLDKTYELGLKNENSKGVMDAVDFIETIRQTEDKSEIEVGKHVVVIGAGNTAIDAAVQAKRLGAKSVSLVYRRGEKQMSATEWEVELARANDVQIKLWSTPVEIKGNNKVRGIKFAKTRTHEGRLETTNKVYKLKADMVLKAIGQKLSTEDLEDLDLEKGKIVVDKNYQTSKQKIYAGGDAIASGDDLTVQAVEDGKQAALAIDKMLKGGK